jgi:5-methylcytosine-specific restriction endonuclease McrA
MSRKLPKIARFRAEAFRRQKGLCYYCRFPMWQDSPTKFAAKHRVTEREAQIFRCTAEHLVARQDGGTDAPSNIVAACLFCNQNRHRRTPPPAPEDYRQGIGTRLMRGKWHAQRYHHMLAGVDPGRALA